MAVATQTTTVAPPTPEPVPVVAVSPPTAPGPQRGITLNPNLFKREEYVSTTYVARIPAEHDFDDILVPEYWAHVAPKMRLLTKVEATNDKFWALLLVMSCGDTWAKVIVLHKVDISASAASEPVRTHYKIDKNSDGYRVIHRDTGRTIAEKLLNRDTAENYLDQFLAKLAG